MSVGENGKLQGEYDREKYMAGQDTWPVKSGDSEIHTQRRVQDKNMHAHTNREEGKSHSHQAELLVKEEYALVGVGVRCEVHIGSHCGWC